MPSPGGVLPPQQVLPQPDAFSALVAHVRNLDWTPLFVRGMYIAYAIILLILTVVVLIIVFHRYAYGFWGYQPVSWTTIIPREVGPIRPKLSATEVSKTSNLTYRLAWVSREELIKTIDRMQEVQGSPNSVSKRLREQDQDAFRVRDDVPRMQYIEVRVPSTTSSEHTTIGFIQCHPFRVHVGGRTTNMFVVRSAYIHPRERDKRYFPELIKGVVQSAVRLDAHSGVFFTTGALPYAHAAVLHRVVTHVIPPVQAREVAWVVDDASAVPPWLCGEDDRHDADAREDDSQDACDAYGCQVYGTIDRETWGALFQANHVLLFGRKTPSSSMPAELDARSQPWMHISVRRGGGCTNGGADDTDDTDDTGATDDTDDTDREPIVYVHSTSHHTSDVRSHTSEVELLEKALLWYIHVNHRRLPVVRVVTVAPMHTSLLPANEWQPFDDHYMYFYNYHVDRARVSIPSANHLAFLLD